MTLRLATRRSPLAMIQANYVADSLARHGIETTIVPLETAGDQSTAALSSLGGQGIFAVEIQRAVLDGRADVAVHSAKDLPSLTPDGLVIAAVPERRDARDVLVGARLDELAHGATVATGSPRRRAFLLERRPDLHIVELRGNMATRLAAAGRDGVRAVVAAAAALERLGEIALGTEYLDPTWFVPQVGQGALALEIRSDDEHAAAALRLLNDPVAEQTLLAERAFLRELGAGCSLPVAAHATLSHEGLSLRGVMAAADGSRSVRATHLGSDPEILGAGLAAYLRDECGGAALVG